MKYRDHFHHLIPESTKCIRTSHLPVISLPLPPSRSRALRSPTVCSLALERELLLSQLAQLDQLDQLSRLSLHVRLCNVMLMKKWSQRLECKAGNESALYFLHCSPILSLTPLAGHHLPTYLPQRIFDQRRCFCARLEPLLPRPVSI